PRWASPRAPPPPSARQISLRNGRHPLRAPGRRRIPGPARPAAGKLYRRRRGLPGRPPLAASGHGQEEAEEDAPEMPLRSPDPGEPCDQRASRPGRESGRETVSEPEGEQRTEDAAPVEREARDQVEEREREIEARQRLEGLLRRAGGPSDSAQER